MFFDYGVLERWGIDSSKLPEGAIIANMPFVVQYKYYIWAAGFILVVMLLRFLVTKESDIYRRLYIRRMRRRS